MANILIIEDDADIREGVRILLESENYTVQEADCGRAGLGILNDEVDLVILDIMVSNLLVVLCGNKDAQPIVNSGSLY